MDLFSVSDLGAAVATAIANPSTYIGKTIGLGSEALTGKDIAAQLGVAVGEEVTYVPIPAEVFATFPFPGAGDLANMFVFYTDHHDKVGFPTF